MHLLITDYALRITHYATMKILHILKIEPEDSVKKIIEEQKKDHDIDVVSLTECKDYRSIMNLIENADKVMVW